MKVASACSNCEKSIENADFVLCILSAEKHHYWRQNMTYEQYSTMNINDLEDFKCSQCKLQLKDLRSPEPDLRITVTIPVQTDLNIYIPAIVTNVQPGQGLVTSCENQTIPTNMSFIK